MLVDISLDTIFPWSNVQAYAKIFCDRYQNTLRKFWWVALRQYRYVVADSEEMLVEEKTFR